MTEPLAAPSTWIGLAAHGVVIARPGGGALLVDRPALRRYREPIVHIGQPSNLPPIVDDVALRPMPPLPADLADHAGWYAGGGRRVLLTQVAEAYFGEPMILVEEGGVVGRAYPLDERTLVTDGAELLELADGQLRATRPGTAVSLARCYLERPVAFPVGAVRLAGTVILPRSPAATAGGPYPAAVLVHGAAGGQRDFCRLQAAALLDAGLAVLIYDKAGHGRSGGTEPSIFDQAAAVEAAFDHLRAQPDIDRARVGLVGMSNGMWAVPMVAARRADVAFVAGLGSPGVSMAEAEVHRRTKILRDAGVGPDSLAAVADAWRCMFTIVADGPSTEVNARLARALAVIATATDLARYEVPDYVRQNPMVSPIPPPVPAEDLVELLGADRDPQLAYDPVVDYARVRCPVLLQYGADDTSVPAARSAAAIRQAIGDQLTVRIYPGLEHMLNQVPQLSGLSEEESIYQFHDFRFGPTVWSDLAAWLTATATQPRTGPAA